MTIRLVAADDHPLLLDAMEYRFQREADFQLMARCTDGIEAMAAVRKHLPDVAVLDIRMPGKSGLDAAREILAEGIPTRVVIITARLDEDELLEAVRAGVRGIVLKDIPPQLLVDCIRTVHAGEQWIERRMAGLSLEKLLRREDGAKKISSLLTPREAEILEMIIRGLRNREIGQKLFIGEGTVKTHLHSIFKKLNVDSRLALLRYAKEHGLL